jgi:ribosome biogenesis GTPase A
MSLQWYPGHMTKARRELTALLPSQDVIIEVLDARLPSSSSNPLVGELRQQKPCVRVLTKSDLADPAVTKSWIRHLQADGNAVVFASSPERPRETSKRVVELCAQLAPPRGPLRPVRALITGVPNVGKSTLINTLMGRAVAAVSNKPAVTQRQQRVVLKNGMVLTDSPGLMWPKIEDEASALRLALAGSIPDTAFDYLQVATFAARLFLAQYSTLVVARFKLAAVPVDAEALLAEISRRRGALRPGGAFDLQKAAEVLVHEFRSGALGRISLERPGVDPISKSGHDWTRMRTPS